jgi:uncharacterized protein
MFHLYITLFYIIPGIYSYIRLSRFLSGIRAKVYFGIFFLILFASFPLTEWLSHMQGGPDFTHYLKFGYYSIPYLLYLFLGILLTDLLLLVNLVFKVVSDEKLKGRKFRTILLSILIVLPSFIVIGGIINHENLTIKHYKIAIDKRRSDLDKLRIVFASDLHIKGKSDLKMLDRFVKAANLENPDIVILGGDIFEGDRTDLDNSFVKERFNQVKSRYGIFAAFGNHEYHHLTDTMKFFADLGIKMLQDEVVIVGNEFYLGGRTDSRFQIRKSIDDLLKGRNRDLPVIIMDHKPSDIKEVSNRDVDIQLSGHTHRGQLFPLNFIVNAIYDLSYGYKKIGNTNFFVTSGLQTWGPAVRTVGHSEIVVIDVDFR